MQRDKFWMSALWGRIGAALILIFGTFLQSRGIDVTQEQMDSANSVIGKLIENIHIVIAVGLVVVSKLREGKKSPESQSGLADNKLLAIIVVCCTLFACVHMMAGCATQQSATQQLMAKTSDPAIIAKGTFADAQDLYIEAQQLYLPYQPTIKKSNSDLDAEILGTFRKANAILDDWYAHGDVPADDKEHFRQYLRQISISLAELLEKKYQK